MQIQPALIGSRPKHTSNPVGNSLEYSAEVAPHGDTIRATTTVAVSKKLQLLVVHLSMDRTAVSSDQEPAHFGVHINPANGSEYVAIAIDLENKSLNAHEEIFIHVGLTILEGDVLNVHTSDLSVSGTIRYTANILFETIDIQSSHI